MFWKKRILIAALLIFITTIGIPASPSGFVSIDDANIFYKFIENNGNQRKETIIFLHGGPGLDHNTFLPHLKTLDRYNLLFYDQRGCGKSDGRIDLGKLKINVLINDLEMIRHLFEIDSFSIISHGFGSIIALEYAKVFPKNVNFLTFISPMGLSDNYETVFQNKIDSILDDTTKLEIRHWEGDLMSSSLDTLDIALTNIFLLRLPSLFYNSNKADEFNLHEFSNLAAAGFLYSIDFKKIKAHSASISAPMLIIYGAHDPYPETAYKEYLEYFPKASLHVIEETGHFPFIEKPEKVIELINTFMQ